MTFRLLVFWARQGSQTGPQIVGHNLPVSAYAPTMLSLFLGLWNLTGNLKIVLLLQQTVRQINLRPDSRVIWWQICNAWLAIPSPESNFMLFPLLSLCGPKATKAPFHWPLSHLPASLLLLFFLIMHNFLFPLEWKIIPHLPRSANIP